ncbi:MAG: biotin-dependent carboxyltransferase family protein, partial [Comamonas sp.]
VLGSCSRDTLAQVGPAALAAGDRIAVGSAVPPSDLRAVQMEPGAVPALPRTGDEVWLDVIPGPRTDWFTPEALALLASQPWRVTPQSNRVGMRLHGAMPLARSRHDELPSEGTATGAIQVPASGQPVLFLADHPLTGGYPVIAVVARHHLDLAAQIPVGCSVRFRVVAPFSEQVLP